MIDTRPAPLVPQEVDLRDFPYTPIVRSRLFGSTFHAEANDSEWRAGMTLWLRSWEQAPAGSLPSDDVNQCRLAELGRDMRTWKKLKARSLHGWFEASDARLYHRVVSEVVLEAWLEKLGQQLSGGSGNAKRWHIEFDPEPLMRQIDAARRMLFALNPQSRALRKRRPSGVPTGQKSVPDGNANGNAGGNPDGNPGRDPGGIAIEVKRMGANGSDIQNRGSGVDPPSVPDAAVDNPAKPAVEKIKKANGRGKSDGAGQAWDDPAYVSASAITFDKPRREGEAYDAWRDRVITESQHRQARARH